ncbi:MAG TPA: membrane protein insertion efficiency factor YidD, partial [Patescibacteria group bacterium]|nr:membrane protein insertion efficiency factor YidD [Patescibacteria group bacterium]
MTKKIMKKILINIIELYQRTLSPDHGWFSHSHPIGYCKFEPTCSEYTKLAIIKHGSLKGLVLG